MITIVALTSDGEKKQVNISFDGWYATRALCFAETPSKRAMLQKILDRNAIMDIPRGEGVTISIKPECYKQPVAVV